VGGGENKWFPLTNPVTVNTVSNGLNAEPCCIPIFSSKHLLLQLEVIQRWSGNMLLVTLNFDVSKIPFVHF